MRLSRTLRLTALLLLWAPLANAQTGVAPPTNALAITGATVVPAPGQVIENATLVIRDGIITAVGAGADIPWDARVVEADSMFLYAGFIDPLSYVGQEPPRQGGGQQEPVADRDNPPFDRAGLEPYRSVRNMLDPAHASVKSMREAGFTAAHAVPRGRMLPGAGAVVRLDGESADDMVLVADVSLFAQFRGGQGVYPGTPMAMMAKMRQLYREAERRHALTEAYQDDPSGMTAPPVDPVHSALFPLIEGDKPVFFLVDDALESHRALTLREDLGFRLVLAGLPQGYDLADKLAASGVPLAVTTDFPRKPGWMAKLKRDSLLTVMDNYDPDVRTATWRDTEAEVRNLEARQALAREDYLENAATLAEAGARFAFTHIETSAGDIHSNIGEMLAAGLDTTTALAALTTNAADVIGMSRAMGSLEAGKLGNVVITSGPLFAEGTEIRHVIIEGKIFDIESKASSPGGGGDGDNSDSIAGLWDMVASTPDGDIGGTIEFSGSPGSMTAVVTYDGAPQGIDVSSVEVDGNSVAFSFQSPNGFITISLERNGDSMSGSATLDGLDSIPLTLTRDPS
ncbi:MAG: amidohydrolase family protein [Rhodothermales bacterium]|nr:amidohydrolase family protein [Rhodothermales bacterium]MBO6780537.1 amidohydrolase family protein [Rhodothermales bacterium]